MNQTQHTPDFEMLRRIAARMSPAALLWTANDASAAAEMAEKLERAGCRVLKSSGYYRDEASFYRAEYRRRIAR